MRNAKTFLALTAVASAAVAASAYAAGRADQVLMTTPAGITLQEMAGTARGARNEVNKDSKTPGFLPGGGMRRSTNFWFADQNGMTLYTYDKDTTPGKSACVAECATAWPPALAPANAQIGGDWSTITRDDGKKQWALKGKPLYTFAKEPDVGTAAGNGAEGGWRAQAMNASSYVARPYGIAVSESRMAGGYVLSNSIGLVLYAYNGKGAHAEQTCVTSVCPKRWEPVPAPRLGMATGDFTIVSRDDGIKQWAFKGKPLYTYAGDIQPGDLFGLDASKDFAPAMVTKNFMPKDAALYFDRARGPIVTTKEGKTLYRLDTSYHTPDGHGLPGSVPGSPKVGRTMGTSACDAECLKTWKPFVAGKDEVAGGDWTIMVRSDGTRQWAYKGFAAYTFPGDKKKGDRTGSDIYKVLTADSIKDDVYRQDKFGQQVVRNTDSAATFWAYIEP